MRIDTLLIANRGEIACRIMRTAHRMGIRCVAVYSEADAGERHVRMADEAICIGPAPAGDSYLDIANILDAAARSGAQAIHPGYGFLSENADFAEACEEAGRIFIGPPPAAIRAMAQKHVAKSLMEAAGVPVIPGDPGSDQEPAQLHAAADRIGYPILIKAVSGGGGRGMRAVERSDEFIPALEAARREASSAFGDDRVLLERLLSRSRHIEVQIFADAHGQVVHLFERDCSIQRRHQKIIEESPAVGLTLGLREAMGAAAVQAARAIDYRGAGTVEFLLDLAAAEPTFHFIEMNTRLQVEHPVTEMVTGVDLVEWQIRVASGAPLPQSQDDLQLQGHSIEVRIYAENSQKGFLPASGPVLYLAEPETDSALRIDSGVESGDVISVYYDSMIAKLIAWGEDRDRALARLRAALGQYHLSGPPTNVPLLRRIASHREFQAGGVDSRFLDLHADSLINEPSDLDGDALLFACIDSLLGRHDRRGPVPSKSWDRHSPWNESDSWRLNQEASEVLRFSCDDRDHDVRVRHEGDGAYLLSLPAGDLLVTGECLERAQLPGAAGELHRFRVTSAGAVCEVTAVRRHNDIDIFHEGGPVRLVLRNLLETGVDDESQTGTIVTPMPGKVIRVHARPGDRVHRGQPLLVLEAMKMEHEICAGADAEVEAVFVSEGDQVDDDAALIALK